MPKDNVIEIKKPEPFVDDPITEILRNGSLTIPSIVRRAQYENLNAFLDKTQRDKDFIPKWLAVEEANIYRTRKKTSKLCTLTADDEPQLKKAA